MEKQEAREALRKIYLGMKGTEPRILSSELAQAGKNLAPMATYIDGVFHAYPTTTSYAKQVYSHPDPEALLRELAADGYPKKVKRKGGRRSAKPAGGKRK